MKLWDSYGHALLHQRESQMQQTYSLERSQFFKVQEIHLYYTGGMFYVNVLLTLHLQN